MANIDQQRAPEENESVASFAVREQLQNNGIHLQDKILGTGSYSKVVVAYSGKLDRLVAIKKIDRRQRNEYTKRFLPREVKLVTQLNHPNIVRVFEVSAFVYFWFLEKICEKGEILEK